ncbi:MAG: hypothetical protein HY782_07840 [Chloroflexi bacterium]|nr:hypothetical protein [Chloroflexota bacterium]
MPMGSTKFYLDQWTEWPNRQMGLWVYPESAYVGNTSPETAFGIEIFDDVHRLWYLFSDQTERAWQDGQDAFRLLSAPLNQWSYQVIDIAADYDRFDWTPPPPKTIIEGYRSPTKPMINFRLFVATTSQQAGTFGGCFGSIIQHLP